MARSLNSFGVTLLMFITFNSFGVKGHNSDLSEYYTELVGLSISAL
jgi:hypothetical protein